VTKISWERVRQKAFGLYGGCGYDQRQLFIDKMPRMLRHEDPVMKGSGTWVDCSVFVPDDEHTNADA
jgi:hypothetical protein